MNSFGFYYTPFVSNERLESNKTYVVQSGDSLYKIAKANNVSVEELMKANSLTTTLIYPNQVIIIPKRINNGAVYFDEYIIIDGDTLETISMKSNVSLDELSKYNDLTKLMLVPMQIVKIPNGYKKYTIVATDTWDYILRKTNMTAEELLNANTEKWLVPGEVINVK